MLKITNGVSLQPLSGAAPKHVVLLLHGFGSNGNDLISFAPAWQEAMPDALFLSPHAPTQCDIMGSGYQWFALPGLDPVALGKGAASAAPAIEAFIDRKLAQYGLTDRDLAIAGFSQGAMMALQVGLRRPRPVAAIVGYSGALLGIADLPQDGSVESPILLVHGSADPVVPVAALGLAKDTLLKTGFDVTTHVAQGVGHTIDAKGLELGEKFVSRAFDAV